LYKWAGVGVLPMVIVGIGSILLVFWLWLGRND
jgi:hypothetical protein